MEQRATKPSENVGGWGGGHLHLNEETWTVCRASKFRRMCFKALDLLRAELSDNEAMHKGSDRTKRASSSSATKEQSH